MSGLLDIEELTKDFRHQWTFRAFRAVSDINLSVREGEIFGLIGHNGAGKTTTFKLLLGFLRPTSGRSLFLGRASASTWARQQIGFLPEQAYFYDHLSVRETLEFYAGLYGLRGGECRTRVGELAERLQLTHKLEAPVRSLSKGNLQRVGIAQSIIHRPRLVILDEPMSGLDPLGRRDMRELILSLKRDGSTVIFSSHILPDAEALCDRVGILVSGTVRDVVDLRQFDGHTPVGFQLGVSGVEVSALGALGAAADVHGSNGTTRLTLTLPDRERVREAMRIVEAQGGQIDSLLPITPSLEERFLGYLEDEAHAEG
jgi:ABC-2 type transport system ATP-binding protein